MMALAIMGIVVASTIPMLIASMREMQLTADARSVLTSAAYAKLMAISKMTRSRLAFDLARNQWKVERFNRSAGEFELQDAVNTLSNGIAGSGITFRANSSSAPTGFSTISSNAIMFNSRGIPIDTLGRPTPDNIIYISKGDANYAVSVSLSGKVQLWRNKAGQWAVQ